MKKPYIFYYKSNFLWIYVLIYLTIFKCPLPVKKLPAKHSHFSGRVDNNICMWINFWYLIIYYYLLIVIFYTRKDNEKRLLPCITICSLSSYKNAGFHLTYEDFDNQTFEKTEIFDSKTIGELENASAYYMVEVASIFHGRCYTVCHLEVNLITWTRKMKYIECSRPRRLGGKISGSTYRHGFSCWEYLRSAKD